MALEWGMAGAGYRILKDLLSLISSRFTPKDPAEVLRRRTRWKAEFESHKLSLRKQDVIVRNLARMDAYPDIDAQAKGISSWFKTEFKDLYHRGFEVYLSVETIKHVQDGGWVYCKHDDPLAVKVFLVGKIPYDLVTEVDWQGDEYYRCPHVYCRFSGNKSKEPYESIVFCEIDAGGIDGYHPEVVTLDAVRKLSKKLRVRD